MACTHVPHKKALESRTHGCSALNTEGVEAKQDHPQASFETLLNQCYQLIHETLDNFQNHADEDSEEEFDDEDEDFDDDEELDDDDEDFDDDDDDFDDDDFDDDDLDDEDFDDDDFDDEEEEEEEQP